MHDILSQVAYPDEVEDAVHAIAREGKIMNSEIDSYITKIDELISQDYVKEWFDKDNKVMNEKEILLKDETVLRPDRIIISKDKTIIVDYKFGSKERESYNNQVRDYMNQLWVMGYKNIEGYIWYVTLNKKVKIELQQGTLF